MSKLKVSAIQTARYLLEKSTEEFRYFEEKMRLLDEILCEIENGIRKAELRHYLHSLPYERD